MNNQRRKTIAEIRERLDALICELEQVRDEEQDAFDNMPESLQYSDRGARAEQAASTLENAVEELRSVDQELEEASE